MAQTSLRGEEGLKHRGFTVTSMATNSAILIPPPAPPATVAGTNDIRGIKPPVEIPSGWAWLYWTAGVLLVVALVITAVLMWLAKLKQRASTPPVPPHVRARLKLEAALLSIGDPRAFCTAVSDAVRVYLEERFELRAPESTTEEFLRDLQKTSALNEAQKASLSGFLEQCDLVKFARFEPTEAALRELHESALRLVHETQHDPGTAPNPPDATSRQHPAGETELAKHQQDAGGTLP